MFKAMQVNQPDRSVSDARRTYGEASTLRFIAQIEIKGHHGAQNTGESREKVQERRGGPAQIRLPDLVSGLPKQWWQV